MSTTESNAFNENKYEEVVSMLSVLLEDKSNISTAYYLGNSPESLERLNKFRLLDLVNNGALIKFEYWITRYSLYSIVGERLGDIASICGMTFLNIIVPLLEESDIGEARVHQATIRLIDEDRLIEPIVVFILQLFASNQN